MKALVLFLAVNLVSTPCFAGEVTPFKECASIRNAIGYTMTGIMRTAGFKTTTGNVKYHEGTFVLNDNENVVICSSGPFYPGYKVEMTLKTIMPIFSCQTRLSGEIVLRKRINDDGVTEIYADCK